MHIAADISAQLVNPIGAAFISADQRIGGHNVVAVVVRQAFRFQNFFAQTVAVNDVVGTNQTSQVKGFGRGIEMRR